MLNFTTSLFLVYLAGTGAVANASIVTSGLVRAVKRAAGGNIERRLWDAEASKAA